MMSAPAAARSSASDPVLTPPPTIKGRETHFLTTETKEGESGLYYARTSLEIHESETECLSCHGVGGSYFGVIEGDALGLAYESSCAAFSNNDVSQGNCFETSFPYRVDA